MCDENGVLRPYLFHRNTKQRIKEKYDLSGITFEMLKAKNNQRSNYLRLHVNK